ncbi:hypothetical protein [Natronocalculus amylovorans]|uniref:Uncharacterized protein n=1 Tax=Natronocalculus amylovorans TaxID=2917812 RepID=A0AAE3FXJ4_9EURY|nr:hypothetical protein [Natronocalculus amylovorans]MCL9816858.1 hypothetical protein [Natronocalculus amylovorans]NUE01299.1 hypothetical protein [Halorubraceae archaeon YAN]
MDINKLDKELARTFESTAKERRVLCRQARDLVDSGLDERDRGHALTVDELITHLSDAPEEHSLTERWNWWMGALDIAYGGYQQFTIHHLSDEPELNR